MTAASAEMKWVNGWSAAATFEGEFSHVTRSYAGKGVARYTWGRLPAMPDHHDTAKETPMRAAISVPYTHLTLPTSHLV